MKIVFIGDVYGRYGLEMLEEKIGYIKETYKPNMIIVNGENAANGRGITQKIYKRLMQMGISVITMGNWVWGNDDLLTFIDDANICRPANFLQAPGKGYIVINYNQKRVLIINLLGRVFMNPSMENPFLVAKHILDTVPHDYSLIDFHAEATSEKVAMGHYLDGIADVVVGTHTHVATSDYRVLPKGTLYITDVGMTGSLDGVIGVNKDIVIERFLNGFSRANEAQEGPKQLNAVCVDLVRKKIEPIHLES